MKEAILIIIGALISCGTTWLLDFTRAKREEKLYYKKKKEETYLLITKVIYKLCGSEGQYINDTNRQELYDKIMDITVDLEIYASKKVYTYFAKTIVKKLNPQSNFNFSNNELTEFIKLIKKDLNIEDI